jgi:ribonuclease P protein component
MRTAPFGLPRRLRLRKRKAFLRLQRMGTRGNRPTCTVVLRYVPVGQEKIGLTVSKKVGNAVVRNRIKRRLRHILRTKPELYRNYELNVIAHPKAKDASFLEIEKDVWSAFSHAQKKCKQRVKRTHPSKGKVS